MTAFHKGTILTEYGLIGSLILVACIAGFLTVGSSLTQVFSDFRNEMAHQNQSTIANTATDASTDSFPANEQKSPQHLLTRQLQAKGANGTTQMLASQLERLAKQSVQSGKMSQSQSDALLRLANQGHRLARIESLVENAVVFSKGNPEKLKNTRFHLDGKNYTAQELGQLLGFNLDHQSANFTAKAILSDYSSQAQPEMKALLSLFRELEASGLLQNDQMRVTVEGKTIQIATIAELVEDVMQDSIRLNAPIKDKKDFNRKIADSSTRLSAEN